MTRPTPRRKPAAVLATTLVTFSLGATLAVLVAGSASAAGSKGTTTSKAKTTTTKKAKTPTPTPATAPNSPSAHFFVINGTVNAASDHEIVGSSAFPNFTTGAVDNYYSMARSHVDNSPFAEGTASPADTGPIGQTAAAGNTQQPQYADARWPGDPPKATYGNQGGPYAAAAAAEYHATADAAEASNGLSAPGPTGATTLAVPKGFDGKLREALAGWKAKWQSVAPTKPPAVTTPVATVPIPKTPVPKPPVPKAKVTTPTATVTTPVATVTTPTPTTPVGGLPITPTVTTPPPPPLPLANAPRTATPSRSLASASASSKPADGETLLTSSTLATLDSKTNTLVTSGESSLKRVSLGGGQIVIEGIHVTASIANDGTPTYKAAVSVASATIGGVPVTIDQDGVHVAGQGQGLPYQQASDALNGALKQAGIQLFLVAPEVTKPCGQTGTSSGAGTTPTTTTSSPTTTTASSDQSSTTSSCDQTGATAGCDQSGGGAVGGTGPALPSVGSSTTTTTTSNDQTNTTTTPSSCDQTGATGTCDQTGTGPGGGKGGGTGPGLPGIGTTTTTSKNTTTTSRNTTTTSSDRSATTTTTTTTTPNGGCDQSGTAPSTSSCSKAGTSTTSTGQTDTSAAPSPFDPTALGGGNSAEEKVTATGVHLVFTQPVNQSGVPAQYAEHILGEVSVDSLAVPAGPPPKLDLSPSSLSSSSTAASSSCGGGHSIGGTSSGASTAGGSGSSTAGGSSSVGGSGSASSVSPSASSSTSQSGSGSGSTGNSLPAAFAAALRKPLWLLLAYVLWQALVIGTGASLWNWRRGEAS